MFIEKQPPDLTPNSPTSPSSETPPLLERVFSQEKVETVAKESLDESALKEKSPTPSDLSKITEKYADSEALKIQQATDPHFLTESIDDFSPLIKIKKQINFNKLVDKNIDELVDILKSDYFLESEKLQKLDDDLSRHKNQLAINKDKILEKEKHIKSYRIRYPDIERMPSLKREILKELEEDLKDLYLKNEKIKENIKSNRLKISDIKKENPNIEITNQKRERIQYLIIEKVLGEIDQEIDDLTNDLHQSEKDFSKDKMNDIEKQLFKKEQELLENQRNIKKSREELYLQPGEEVDPLDFSLEASDLRLSMHKNTKLVEQINILKQNYSKLETLSNKISSLKNAIKEKIEKRNEKEYDILKELGIKKTSIQEINNLKCGLEKNKFKLIDKEGLNKKIKNLKTELLTIQVKIKSCEEELQRIPVEERSAHVELVEEKEKLMKDKDKVMMELKRSIESLKLHDKVSQLEKEIALKERTLEMDRNLSYYLTESHLTQNPGYLHFSSTRNLLILKFKQTLNNRKLGYSEDRLFDTLAGLESSFKLPKEIASTLSSETSDSSFAGQTPTVQTPFNVFTAPLFPLSPASIPPATPFPESPLPPSVSSIPKVREPSFSSTIGAKLGITAYNLNKKTDKRKLKKDISSLSEERERLISQTKKMKNYLKSGLKEAVRLQKEGRIPKSELIDFVSSFDLDKISHSGLSRSELLSLINFLENYSLIDFESKPLRVKELVENLITFASLSHQLFMNQLRQEIRGAIVKEDELQLSTLCHLMGDVVDVSSKGGSLFSTEIAQTLFHVINIGGVSFTGLISVGQGVQGLIENVDIHRTNSKNLENLDKEITNLSDQLKELNNQLKLAHGKYKRKLENQILKLEIEIEARKAKKNKIVEEDKLANDFSISRNALSVTSGAAGLTSASLAVAGIAKSTGMAVAIGAGALSIGAAATGIGAAVLGGTALLIGGIILGKRYKDKEAFKPVKQQYKKIKELERQYHQQLEVMSRTEKMNDERYNELKENLLVIFQKIKEEEKELEVIYNKFLETSFNKITNKISEDVLEKISKNITSLDEPHLIDLIKGLEPSQDEGYLKSLGMEKLQEYGKERTIKFAIGRS